MSEIEERIKKIKEEIRTTPYHKGTEHHIGRLKARLASLQNELYQGLEKKRGSTPFAIKKEGNATVIIIGFPSVGKSTLLNSLTNARAKVADYPFTTMTVIPGIMNLKGAKIQVLDLPGFITGAAKGKGSGKEVLSVARVADFLLIMVDSTKKDQLELIKKELEEAGIRINRREPEVIINKTTKGGIKVYLSPVVGDLTIEQVKEVAKEFRLTNAEIHIKESLTVDDLIDAFCQNRVFIPALVVVNKIDLLEKPQIASLNEGDWILISAQKKVGLENLKEKIWKELGLIRVYLKPEGGNTDLNQPLILKSGQTVYEASQKLSTDLAKDLKRARIWGNSVKFPGQVVSLSHILEDEDILNLLTR